MEKTLFTKNTKEAILFLENLGFKGLSFFQGKEFIYAFITTRANKHGQWHEKNYATFNETDMQSMPYISEELSTLEEFKKHVESLIN